LILALGNYYAVKEPALDSNLCVRSACLASELHAR
jgi:hypothetical protein